MSADLAAAVATWLEKRRSYVEAAVHGARDATVALAELGDADEALADAYRDLNTWPRTWHLPTIPADVTRVTANGALYERDPDRPSRWYQLNSVHARVVGGSCELGQLFQVAGPDGIREAVPDG